jgi:hypothetical protein
MNQAQDDGSLARVPPSRSSSIIQNHLRLKQLYSRLINELRQSNEFMLLKFPKERSIAKHGRRRDARGKCQKKLFFPLRRGIQMEGIDIDAKLWPQRNLRLVTLYTSKGVSFT